MPEHQEPKLEVLHAIGKEVYTTDQAVRITSVAYGINSGLSEEESRAYAAQFAASTQLRQALKNLLRFVADKYTHHPDFLDAVHEARAALVAAEPKRRARPFKRKEHPHCIL